MPQTTTAAHFCQGGVEIPERKHGEGDEAIGCDRRELNLVVVVGLNAGELETLVLQRHERMTLEGDHIRVQHLGVNAVGVHMGQPGLGVVAGRIGLLQGRRARGRELAPSRHAVVADQAAPAVPHHPTPRAGGLVEQDAWRVVTKTIRHTRRPQVDRLGEMRVGVNHA